MTRARQALLESAGSKPASVRPEHIETININRVIHAVAFSPDSAHLAIACYGRTAFVTDLAGQRQLRLNHKSTCERIRDVAFSPRGDLIATGGDDKTAHIWETSTGRERYTWRYPFGVFGIAFSPDGTQLAVTVPWSKDSVQILNPTGTAQGRFPHPDGGVAATFSRDGSQLATCGHDKTTQIWDVATGAHQHTLAHPGLLYSVSFGPDSLLATAGKDGTAYLWETISGTQLHAFPYPAPIYKVALSPQGLLAVAGEQGTVDLWNIHSGEKLCTITHAQRVFTAAFNADGQLLATGSADRTIQLWRLTGT